MPYRRSFWLIGVCLGAIGSSANAAEPNLDAGRVATWRTVVVLEAPVGAEKDWTASVRATPPPARPGGRGASPRFLGPAHALDGIASFYWQGQKTASGEPFDKAAMTAAHPTLPFNTRVRVTHLHTGRTVEVRINDRGPFKPGRVIDLSQKAAEELGMTARGLARVRLEVVSN